MELEVGRWWLRRVVVVLGGDDDHGLCILLLFKDMMRWCSRLVSEQNC
ncbi:hypothetical protein HanRHA438_Chr14g0675971 [Helianthus annuus]|nr:hypothetical protein HanRHA438_Chr14g0675971 [Helianthus annuus]